MKFTWFLSNQNIRNWWGCTYVGFDERSQYSARDLGNSSHNCEFSSKSMIVVDFRIFSDARQLSVTQEELYKSHVLLVTIENWRFIVHVWEMWPIAAPKINNPYEMFWLTSAQCTFANSGLTYLSNSLRHVANWFSCGRPPPLSCSLIGTVARRLKDSKTYAFAGLFLSISFLFIFNYFMCISWDHKSEQSLDHHDTTLLPWRIFTLINLCQLRCLVC